MTYTPSAESFQKAKKGFTPSAEHFAKLKQDDESSVQLDALQSNHPLLFELAKKLAAHPDAAQAVQGLADSPVTETGISAGPAFINAFKNIANLSPLKFKSNYQGFPEVEARGPESEPLSPRMERGFAEPKSVGGKIGSLVGEMLGAGTAFLANPASATLPGALATGFAEGEGGIANRSIDAVIGTLLPGALHAGKFGKKLLDKKKIGANIRGIELEKAQADKSIFNAKESLANQLTKHLNPVTEGKKALTTSLEKLAGESESASKSAVAKAVKETEHSIVKKYNQQYEGFNASNAGQSPVKDPVQIQSLMKEYGLNRDNFSSDTRQLIDKLIGKSEAVPESETISVITGKPVNQASIKFDQAKAPKVSEYINLWKQLRAEVGDLRHSMSMATTPEAKQAFRSKASKLEKLSDDINRKAMSSLDAKEAAKYSKIQKGYLEERVPFLEKPLLKRATDKFAEIPDNFFSSLNKAGVPELVSHFKSSHPKLVEAITKHDIKSLSRLGSEELQELTKGDFGRFITSDAKNMLTSLMEHKKAESLLKGALGKVQASEIGRKVKANDIADIIKARPELAKPFKAVEKEQQRLRELKNALIDEGFKLKDITAELNKYKSAVSAAKTAGVPVATYLGIKKAKSSSRDIND